MIKPKNKKAVSLMISYVLLISMAVLMGIIVYQYIKTFVPTDVPSCPEGTSLMILSKDCDSSTLKLIVKNNGRFNTTGFFIYATRINENLPTLNLHPLPPEYQVFIQELQPEQISEEITLAVDLLKTGQNFKIQVVPVKKILDSKKVLRTASCNDAAITENIVCS